MYRRHFLQSSVALAAFSSCERHAITHEQSMAKIIDLICSGQAEAAHFLAYYRSRIAEVDSELRAVIELHPAPCASHQGPLRGAPILIKDNIETCDGMLTTAGSLALLDAPNPEREAFIVTRLRESGAIIFGKTNLSEWANIRSHDSTSGWSARGGLTRNPHNPAHTASGSSSGSAAAVAANLCAAAIGTETNGSIVSPASACGIVGLKPTLGKVSRSGIIPITHWQDTAGPMTRTVRDAALLMDAISAHDPDDVLSSPPPDDANKNHTSLLSLDALRGVRLGIIRDHCGSHAGVLAEFGHAVETLKRAGAEIVDDVEIPNHRAAGSLAWKAMLTELRADLNAYLQKRGGKVRSLAELIAFNEANRSKEMPHFTQDIFEEAERHSTPEIIAEVVKARAISRLLAGPDGIDAALAAHLLDALICPTNDPAGVIDLKKGDANTRVACGPAAVAGYPHLTLPMGRADGLPIGLSFIGTAWSEARLLAYGHAFESWHKTLNSNLRS